MAAPDYVPIRTTSQHYTSPPRRPQPWLAARPGELVQGQPEGAGLGVPGPDQGYALRLARRFEDRLHLHAGESEEDVLIGCVGVALRRAAAFGRAPVSADVEVALGIFGFLDPHADEALVARRTKLFAGVSHPHHYQRATKLAELVPSEVLRRTPAQVADSYKASWQTLLDDSAA